MLIAVDKSFIEIKDDRGLVGRRERTRVGSLGHSFIGVFDELKDLNRGIEMSLAELLKACGSRRGEGTDDCVDIVSLGCFIVLSELVRLEEIGVRDTVSQHRGGLAGKCSHIILQHAFSFLPFQLNGSPLQDRLFDFTVVLAPGNIFFFSFHLFWLLLWLCQQ